MAARACTVRWDRSEFGWKLDKASSAARRLGGGKNFSELKIWFPLGDASALTWRRRNWIKSRREQSTRRRTAKMRANSQKICFEADESAWYGGRGISSFYHVRNPRLIPLGRMLWIALELNHQLKRCYCKLTFCQIVGTIHNWTCSKIDCKAHKISCSISLYNI